MDGGDRLPPRGPAADEAQRSAALEDAVTLLLRHRLFPRAMAWNVRQNVATPEDSLAAEQASLLSAYPAAAPGSTAVASGLAVPRATLEPRFPTSSSGAFEARASPSSDATGSRYAAASRADALDVARSFPLLQASASGAMSHHTLQDDGYRLALDVEARGDRRARVPEQPSGFQHRRETQAMMPPAAAPTDARERLFRTMGKYLDARSSPMGPTGVGLGPPTAGFVQQPAMYQHVAPPSRYEPMPSPERRTLEQQTAFQALKISSYTEELASAQLPAPLAFSAPRSPVDARPASASAPVASETTTSPSVSRETRSPPRSTSGSTSGKKRSRGSTASSHNNSNTIAPSLARALLTGCGAKRCSYGDCNKIAVSKGLCRGHGGGRRCQQAGCTKCAQSRSPFCWAHGGGKRCEAPNCRRSRKTKRFCVDHVEMERTVPLKPEAPPAKPPSAKTRSKAKKASASAAMDSDDSIGGKSTVSCDSNLSAVHNKENSQRNAAAEPQPHAQYQQYAGEQSGFPPPPALQLPSLNDALLRTLPPKPAAGTVWASTPSPPASSPSQYKAGRPSWPPRAGEADPRFPPPGSSR